MADYDNSNTLVLFLDEEKASENHPDYTGKLTLADGTEKRIAAWRRVAGSGKKYLKGTVSDFEPRAASPDEDF